MNYSAEDERAAAGVTTAIDKDSRAAGPGVPIRRALDKSLYESTLFEILLRARKARGGSFNFLEDAERQPLTLDRLVIGSFALAPHIEARSTPGERVGLLLPNAVGFAAVFFACHVSGRVPAMLNFSTGARSVISCCHAARIKTVFTSRRFVALGKLEELVEALGREVEIVWLEDIRNVIGTRQKLVALAQSKIAGWLYRRRRVRPHDPAVVLFTSGTEGVPKGVVLSHANILSNCAQISQIVELMPSDKMFNALPVFHSFGLTGGFMLPLYCGFSCFLYPSPLHYRQIPPLIRDSRSTIVASTDTFAVGWAKMAEAGDFASIRFFVLGAERVKPTTRNMFREKFGLDLFEGYGATEASPILALNVPGATRDGTVGRLLPGIEHRVEKVAGLEAGGKLVVSGPNVMAGYMTIDTPGVLKPPQDGWHDTGDIVDVSADGYVTVQGRAKRFAKIGGEMVSLGAVEGYAAAVWPDNIHAAAAVEDQRKGEQIVLVTDRANADREQLLAWAKANGVPELYLPKRFVFVEEMPLLGTGKMNYVAVNALAKG